MKVHFIDTETTGLGEHDEILSLAIVVWNDGVLEPRYEGLFWPQGKCGEEAAKVNGYKKETWGKDHPNFHGVWQWEHCIDIREAIKDLEYWGGSNPGFDRRMIEGQFRRMREPFFAGHRNIDTCSLAAPLICAGLVKSGSLGALTEYFGLGTQTHGALADAIAAAQVFEKLVETYYGGFSSLIESEAA